MERRCAARDRWIGWDFRHQYGRLKLVVNNSRFLIVPHWHVPNLGSRILSLCQRRLCRDWQEIFGHPVDSCLFNHEQKEFNKAQAASRRSMILRMEASALRRPKPACCATTTLCRPFSFLRSS
ncbi:DUF4338 domain-containing protein [Lacticaseibacillus rhamnosus]